MFNLPLFSVTKLKKPLISPWEFYILRKFMLLVRGRMLILFENNEDSDQGFLVQTLEVILSRFLTLGGDSIKKFQLEFSLKNHLSFGMRFPSLRKSSRMGSLDMSQNQNGISSHFSSRNSSQNVFY